ncbi:hypothetical protein HMPREF9120_01546 [Neisseria sp. oral taxon 020 str. F0370]|nr:hypothetical protein HMPREF9120_01546 [Neisseria sp. oral taxon 020 str. F0370]
MQAVELLRQKGRLKTRFRGFQTAFFAANGICLRVSETSFPRRRERLLPCVSILRIGCADALFVLLRRAVLPLSAACRIIAAAVAFRFVFRFLHLNPLPPFAVMVCRYS